MSAWRGVPVRAGRGVAVACARGRPSAVCRTGGVRVRAGRAVRAEQRAIRVPGRCLRRCPSTGRATRSSAATKVAVGDGCRRACRGSGNAGAVDVCLGDGVGVCRGGGVGCNGGPCVGVAVCVRVRSGAMRNAAGAAAAAAVDDDDDDDDGSGDDGDGDRDVGVDVVHRIACVGVPVDVRVAVHDRGVHRMLGVAMDD